MRRAILSKDSVESVHGTRVETTNSLPWAAAAADAAAVFVSKIGHNIISVPSPCTRGEKTTHSDFDDAPPIMMHLLSAFRNVFLFSF